MEPSLILALAVFAFLLITVAQGVRQVPQGFKWVVQRLGKYSSTLTPGLNFIIPYVDIVAFKVTTKDIVLDIPSQEVITKDNAVIITNAVAYINIISPGSMPTNLLKEVLDDKMSNISKTEIISAKEVFKSGGSLSKARDLCLFLASEFSDGISGKLISAVWDPWKNLIKHKDQLVNSDIYTLRRILPEERNKSFK